jgi:dUTP pyrophosphatase
MEVKVFAPGGVPVRASDGAAGFDLVAQVADGPRGGAVLRPGEVRLVGTGVHVAVPAGFVGLVYLRSSLSRRGVRLANGGGVIDSDYRGEVLLALTSDAGCGEVPVLSPGERVAQLVIVPCPAVRLVAVESVEELGATVRGAGGFGSTGTGAASGATAAPVVDLSPGPDALPGQVGLFGGLSDNNVGARKDRGPMEV